MYGSHRNSGRSRVISRELSTSEGEFFFRLGMGQGPGFACSGDFYSWIVRIKVKIILFIFCLLKLLESQMLSFHNFHSIFTKYFKFHGFPAPKISLNSKKSDYFDFHLVSSYSEKSQLGTGLSLGVVRLRTGSYFCPVVRRCPPISARI